MVEQVFDFQKQKGNYLNVRLISPPVAEKLDCHYQELDGEPFLGIQMCMFLALIALSTKTEFTVDRSLSAHATWNCESKGLLIINQYGY